MNPASNTTRRCGLIVFMFYIVSRIALHLFIGFHFNRIEDFMQFLDVRLLHDDLLSSLWHLQVQPPLLNLSIGILLKTVPAGAQSFVLEMIYLLMGMAIVMGIYWLMVRYAVRHWLAAATAAALSMMPSIIWAEHLPSYIYPVAAALVISAVALQKFADTGRPVWAYTALLLVIAIPLGRSFFHLIFWLLPVLAGVLLLARHIDPHWLRRYVPIVVVGVALVTGVYLKNYLMFGVFTGSTWQGMNLYGVVSMTPKPDVQRLVDEGVATPLALIPRFSAPGIYYRYYGLTPTDSIPALDDTLRTGGAINLNNRVYAKAAQEYQRNAFAVARAYPLEALRGILNEAYLFCGFYTYRLFNDPSRWWVPRTDSILHTAMDIATLYLIPICLLLIVAFTLIRFFKDIRIVLRHNEGRSRYDRVPVAMLFAGFTVLYVAVVACLAELGEGSVLRIPIDPFLAITIGIVAERFVRSSRRAQE